MSKKDTVSKYENNDELATESALVFGTKEVAVEQTSKAVYNQTSVKLQLSIDAHAIYSGQVTGKHYEWARAGSIVAVDSLDAPYLLEKRIQSHSCCSGTDVAIFIKID